MNQWKDNSWMANQSNKSKVVGTSLPHVKMKAWSDWG